MPSVRPSLPLDLQRLLVVAHRFRRLVQGSIVRAQRTQDGRARLVVAALDRQRLGATEIVERVFRLAVVDLHLRGTEQRVDVLRVARQELGKPGACLLVSACVLVQAGQGIQHFVAARHHLVEALVVPDGLGVVVLNPRAIREDLVFLLLGKAVAQSDGLAGIGFSFVDMTERGI